MGEIGIQEELDKKGIQHIGGPQDAAKIVELKPGFALEHDHDVSGTEAATLDRQPCNPCGGTRSPDDCGRTVQVAAVVVGFDRNINYYKIQYATLCIRENPGCLFIATNLDAVTHLTDAQEWAGNGSMVGAIKGEQMGGHRVQCNV